METPRRRVARAPSSAAPGRARRSIRRTLGLASGARAGSSSEDQTTLTVFRTVALLPAASTPVTRTTTLNRLRLRSVFFDGWLHRQLSVTGSSAFTAQGIPDLRNVLRLIRDG